MLNYMFNSIEDLESKYCTSLEEYLEDFKRLAPGYIRSNENLKTFIENSKLYASKTVDGERVYIPENEYPVDMELFVKHKIKFTPTPTILHFYDYEAYPVSCKTVEVEVTEDVLKEYAYLYMVSKNRVRGILKSEIKLIEKTGNSSSLINNPEPEIDYSSRSFGA